MPKLKMFAAIPRRPDISQQEFHDHWRHPHGTLGRRIPLVRRYVQSHRVECEYLGEGQRRFEGVAEAWIDSVADARYFPEEPTYRRELIPDEPLFIDMPRLTFLLAVEDVLVTAAPRELQEAPGNAYWFDDDRAFSIKLIQLVEAQGAQPWRSERDVELGARLGAFRHVCSAPSAEIHGDQPPFLGVRELWWPTLSAFKDGVTADRAAFDELVRRPAKAFTMLAQAERFK